MVYRKYIKRGQRVYGPYEYYSYRDDEGRVKTKYVRKVNHTFNKEKFFKGSFKEEYKKYFIIFFILFITLGGFFLIFYDIKITGKTILLDRTTFSVGEPVSGRISLEFSEGSFYPSDSLIKVSFDTREEKLTLKDFFEFSGVNIEEREGQYYSDISNELSGYGMGYGFEGEKETPVDVYFKIRVYKSGEEVVESEEGNLSVEKNESGKEEVREVVNESINVVERERVESEGGVESGEETNENQQSQINEGEVGEVSESSSRVVEVISEEVMTGSVIKRVFTGKSIDEGSLVEEKEKELEEGKERIVEAKIKRGEEFIYKLKEKEVAEIIDGSVRTGEGEILDNSVLKISKEDENMIITTDYIKKEKGFGEDYLTNKTHSFYLNLENFNFTSNKSGRFLIKFSFEYNNISFFEDSKEIYFEEKMPLIKENFTENLTEFNVSGVKVEVIQYNATIGQPVKWKKRIELTEPKNISVDIPSIASGVVIKKIRSDGSIYEEEYLENNIKIAGKTPEVVEKNEAENLEKIPGEENITYEKAYEKEKNISSKENVLEITGLVSKNKEFFVREENQNNVEESIEINLTARGGDVVTYEIEYETPAPYTEEIEIIRGKQVKVVGVEGITYENVLSFTNLSENFKIRDPRRVKIYWVENSTYINPLNVLDLDNNGLYDYIEWIVPHLSNQTFNIIVVTKAEHLDENRSYVSDIYNEVRALDGVWSEEIPDGHYVRVVFEKNLTNGNDITIYLRVVGGNPRIEVYEINQNLSIAEFSHLISEDYNKVYLRDLTGQQNSFDLRVVGGNIEIEHIVDPQEEGSEYDFRYNDIQINEYAIGSSTWTNLINLSFQPESTSNYLIMGYAEFHGNSTTVREESQLLIDGVDYSFRSVTTKDTDNDWSSYSPIVLVELNNSQAHNISMNFRSGSSTYNVSARNARLMAWAVPIEVYNTSEDSSSKTGEGLISKINLTFTPNESGSRLFLWYAEHHISSGTTNSSLSRIYSYTGGSEWGNNSNKPSASGNWFNLVGFKIVNLSGGSQYNVGIEFGPSGTGTAEMRRARIYVINVERLGLINYYSENESSGSIPNSWTNKTINSYTPSFSGDYLILSTATTGSGSTTYSGGSRTIITNSTQSATHWVESRDTNDMWSHLSFIKANLTSDSSYEDRIEIQAETAGGQAAYSRLLSVRVGGVAVECGNLAQENQLYILNRNVSSSGKCFSILANRVTLNCKGYTINYSISQSSNAIEVEASNVEIKNCKIVQGNRNLESVGGILFYLSNNSLVNNTKIEIYGNSSTGIYTLNSFNLSIENSEIKLSGNSSEGVWLEGCGGGLYNNLRDTKINLSGISSSDVFFNSNNCSLNFTNVSFNKSSVDYYGNSNLSVFWYMDVYVNETNGSSISGANVSGFDVNNVLKFTELTNSSGWITRKTLREYYENASGKFFDTNYTINGTKSGYFGDTKYVNLTGNRIVSDGGEVVLTLERDISLVTSCQVLNVSNREYYLNVNIIASGLFSCINITGENVTFDCNNYKISNNVSNSTSYGIYSEKSDLEIRNCGVEGFNNGAIYFANNSNNKIYNATINASYSGSSGVVLVNSSNNNISSSTFISYGDNTKGTLLNSSGGDGSNNNLVFNNTFKVSGNYATGLYILKSVRNNITSNIFNLTDSGYYGTILSYVNESNLSNNRFFVNADTSIGISLQNNGFKNNISLNNITISGISSYGIEFLSGSQNVLTKNKINISSSISRGISLLSLSNNNFTENDLTLSSDNIYGFYVSNVNNSVFSLNKIYISGTSSQGIMGSNIYYNNFTSNSINLMGSSSYGFYLAGSIVSNNFTSNDINLSGTSSEGFHFHSFDKTDGSILFGNSIRVNGVTSYGISSIGLPGNLSIYNNSISVSSDINSNSYGIYLTSASRGVNISSNKINVSGSGGGLVGIKFIDDVRNNFIISNEVFVYGNNNRAIKLESYSSDNIFMGNKIRTFDNNSYGVEFLFVSANNSMKNESIITEGSSSHAIVFNHSGGVDYGGNHSISGSLIQTNGMDASAILSSINSKRMRVVEINDTILNSSSIGSFSKDIYFYNDNGTIDLINGTFDKSKVGFFQSPGSILNVFWYMDVYVNETNGSSISGANVSGFDVNNVLKFTELTNSSGWITRKTLREYYEMANGKFFDTNYTINGTKSGYFGDTKYVNLTGNRIVSDGGEVVLTLVYNTCNYPGWGNWVINLSHYCVINSDINLGNYNITFVGSGNVTFNSKIKAKSIGPLPANQRGFLGPNATIKVG